MIIQRIFALIAGLCFALAGYAQTETITYLHTDHLGSPVIARDAQGNTLWTDTYDPWGVRLNAPTANDADVGYTGHFEETDIGLTYAQARWYDPEIGRFLSPDDVDYIQGGFFHYNRFVYAANNPYKYSDPNGDSPAPTDIADFGYGVGSLLVTEIVYVAAKLNGNEAVASMAAADMSEARADAIFSTVGLVSAVPGTGRMLRAANNAESFESAVLLSKQLASREQLGQLSSGAGVVISQPAKQADRIAAQAGLDPANIQKVSSDARQAMDGQTIQTHAFRDASTNEIFEPKTIIGD